MSDSQDKLELYTALIKLRSIVEGVVVINDIYDNLIPLGEANINTIAKVDEIIEKYRSEMEYV